MSRSSSELKCTSIHQGNGLLDGSDEVLEAGERRRVAQAVEDFARQNPGGVRLPVMARLVSVCSM